MNWDAVARHLSNLGFVPPEFREAKRIQEDPDELGYTLEVRTGVKALTPGELLETCNNIIPEQEQADLTQAALLCHREHHRDAETHREAAGYGGC